MPSPHPVKVRIRDFQSIENLEFEIRGFTCITGKSNIGKSAIVRAISGAILNHPVGNMVRKGAQFCSVEIGSEGWGFKWEKNDHGVNRIWLPGNDRPLDKLGQVQVEQVAKMGFGNIEIGDDRIQPWLAPQFQVKGSGPLFLLDQSGPRVTDFISEVSRLTVLQDAIVLAARGKRGENDQAKLKGDEAKKIRLQLARVSNLDQLEVLQKELEEQSASIQEYEAKVKLGESIINRIKEAQRKLTVLEKLDDIKQPKDQCKAAFEKLTRVRGHQVKLEACAKKIIAVREVSKITVPEPPTQEIARFRLVAGAAAKISQCKSALHRVNKNIPTAFEVPDFETFKKVVEIAAKIKRLKLELQQSEIELQTLETEAEQISSELAQIVICPTCKRPMPVEHEHTGTRRRAV